MTIDREYIDQLMKGIPERKKQFDEDMKSTFGDPYGRQKLNAQQEAFWFTQQAAANPDWVRALPYVQGGKETIQRYMKARMGGM